MNEPQLWGPQQWERETLAMQPTEAQPVVAFTSPLTLDTPSTGPKAKFATLFSKKGRTARIAVVVIILLIAAVTIYFTWFSAPPDTSMNTGTDTHLQMTTMQNFSATTTSSKASSTSTSAAPTSSSIQVYIVGAVKRPGIYTLDANARVYQVLKAAGGPLADANLVVINLAAPLKDGEEIYIPKVGESVPTTIDGSTGSTGTAGGTSTSAATGVPVNINTASASELQQQLHVSAKTAQAIINYRLQHGTYTSVDQLANAVSKTIYNRIKGMVTV